MKKAIFPGTFDPFHGGHLSILKKGLKIFDEIIIVVSKNTNKTPKESFINRANKIGKTIDANLLSSRVRVLVNEDKLTAYFARDLNINFILRGVRNETDFDFEYEIAKANKQLNKEIETIFIFAEDEDKLISSSILKEIKEFL